MKAYPEDNLFNVALLSGKVRVDRYRTDSINEISSNAFLIPNEQVIFSKKRNFLWKEQADVAKMVQWKEGLLYFDDTQLHNVFKILERWYAVSFEVTDRPDKSKLREPFSGEFKNEALDNVLEAVSFSEKLEYKIKGNTIEIMFN